MSTTYMSDGKAYRACNKGKPERGGLTDCSTRAAPRKVRVFLYDRNGVEVERTLAFPRAAASVATDFLYRMTTERLNGSVRWECD